MTQKGILISENNGVKTVYKQRKKQLFKGTVSRDFLLQVFS
jgi:hypothetical protein